MRRAFGLGHLCVDARHSPFARAEWRRSRPAGQRPAQGNQPAGNAAGISRECGGPAPPVQGPPTIRTI